MFDIPMSLQKKILGISLGNQTIFGNIHKLIGLIKSVGALQTSLLTSLFKTSKQTSQFKYRDHAQALFKVFHQKIIFKGLIKLVL